MSVAQKLCICEHVVFNMFIPKHYDTSKSYVVVHETFSIVFPDNTVTIVTTLQQRVIEFQDRGSVYNKQHIQCEQLSHVACSTTIKTTDLCFKLILPVGLHTLL
jgi:uncharacterized surface anchored protein